MSPFRMKFFIILLVFSWPGATAQEISLVRFQDLDFNSEFEKEAFEHFKSGHADFLELFLAVSPSSDRKLYDRINQEISMESELINNKRYSKLKDEKKINEIYSKVNYNVLKRYKEQTLFPDLFSAGEFNCLTASAYYGFLFSRLNLDFDFRITSSHVHPVVFPKTLQVKVETTDPVFGYLYFDEKIKLQFVDYLLNAKIITKEEVSNTSINDIFNKYYFPESTIGMNELAGLQYLNDAFSYYILDNYHFAFEQSQKAYFLFPSRRVSTVMLFLLSRCLKEAEYKTIDDAAYLVYSSRFVGTELSQEQFMGEFIIMTEKVLLQRSKSDLYDEIVKYLLASIDEGDIHQAVETEYYYQKGNLLMSYFRIKEALENFEKALSLEPGNMELQASAVKCLSLSFASSSNQDNLDNVEEFNNKFPMIQSNESFIGLQMLAYLQLGEEKFDFDQAVEGEVLLNKFENLYQLNPNIDVPYGKVGDAYSSAAVFYFKRNDKAKTRSYILRGLSISPENYQLMYRLRALSE